MNNLRENGHVPLEQLRQGQPNAPLLRPLLRPQGQPIRNGHVPLPPLNLEYRPSRNAFFFNSRKSPVLMNKKKSPKKRSSKPKSKKVVSRSRKSRMMMNKKKVSKSSRKVYRSLRK